MNYYYIVRTGYLYVYLYILSITHWLSVLYMYKYLLK